LQATFIDDMPANVTTTESLGVHAILFEDEASVIEQVERWVAAPD